MTQTELSVPGRALAVMSRVLAAVFGGYLLASAWSVFIAAVFPGGAEAVLAGVQLSFVVYAGAVIWAFSPVPVRRVWAGLLLPAAVLAVLAALLPRFGV